MLNSCSLISLTLNVVGFGATNLTSVIKRPNDGDIKSSIIFLRPGKRCTKYIDLTACFSLASCSANALRTATLMYFSTSNFLFTIWILAVLNFFFS